MPANPHMSTGNSESSDTQAALARYSQSLHKFTQELWLEARRKAELEAQANMRGMRRKKDTHDHPKSPSDGKAPKSPHARN